MVGQRPVFTVWPGIGRRALRAVAGALVVAVALTASAAASVPPARAAAAEASIVGDAASEGPSAAGGADPASAADAAPADGAQSTGSSVGSASDAGAESGEPEPEESGAPSAPTDPTAAAPSPEGEGASEVEMTAPDSAEARAGLDDGPNRIAAMGVPGDTELLVLVEQASGLAPFDALDANAGNAVVRTNDTVTYTINVRNEAAGSPTPPATGNGHATELTIAFTLPKGQQSGPLPNYCDPAHSSITPTGIGAPTMPLDGASWDAFVPQTVICRIDDRVTPGQSFNYLFTAQVRSEVPNGTVLTPFSASVSALEDPDGASSVPLAPLTVVSEARFDLSKNGIAGVADTGYVRQETLECASAVFRDAGFAGCHTVLFPVLISTNRGGKGVSPLASDITFVDDLRPDSFFGAGTTMMPGWNPGFAPAVRDCGTVQTREDGRTVHPFGTSAGGTGGPRNVRNSGTISCGPGSQGEVTVRISGADTTAQVTPTTAGEGGGTLPADRGYVVSSWIRIEFPVDAFAAIGTSTGSNDFNLVIRNNYSALTGTDLSGRPVIAEPMPNNSRGGPVNVQFGYGFMKAFAGEPGNTSNSAGNGYAAGNWAGVSGSQSARDGRGVVQAGSQVISLLQRTFISPPGFGAVGTVICDSWDNTRAALTFKHWGGLNAGAVTPANGGPYAPVPTGGWFQTRPSDGAAVWSSYGSTPGEIRVQYASAPPGQSAANDCRDQSSGWVDHPSSLAGNDPVLAAEGVYTSANLVRVYFTAPKTVEQRLEFDIAFSIGLTVRAGVVPGMVIGNWASARSVYSADGIAPPLDEVVAPATGARLQNATSTYLPGASAGEGHSGVFGDRVVVQALVARLTKAVWNPAASPPAFSTSVTPVYGSGQTVRYQLRPSVTASVVTGARAAVRLEDCLPAGLSFLDSAWAGGEAIHPEEISDTGTAAPRLVCPAGSTYLRWELGERLVGQTIPPIEYRARVLETTGNGSYLNTAMVTAVGDASTPAQRSSAREIQVTTPTGIKITKSVLTPVVEPVPADAAHPRPLVWDVRYAAVDTGGISDPDIIDRLPADGVGASRFHGTAVFESATVTGAAGTTRWYTAAAPASIELDPKHPSNLTDGDTIWCDAVAGGSVVSGDGTAADCPAAAAEVTGLRVRRAGAFPTDGQIAFRVVMHARGGLAGDVYENRAAANSNGVLQGVGPAIRPLTVVSGSIGDRVWFDADADGGLDSGEPGVAGMPVRLLGTDDLGNAITRSATTGADGRYLFDGLASGSYRVVFDRGWALANGYTGFTEQWADDVGAALNSDADADSGQTQQHLLGFAGDYLDLDAGLIRSGGTTPTGGRLPETGAEHRPLLAIGTALLLLGATGLGLQLIRRRGSRRPLLHG